MKKCFLLIFCLAVLTGGCGVVRFSASEAQKGNAWAHYHTAELAANTARIEQASQNLQELTNLSAMQSRAFTVDYGLPRELPALDTPEQVLSQSTWELAERGVSDSANRPDGWKMAEAAVDVGIAVAALFGGAFSLRIINFLKEVRKKTEALREIIQGNEVFKQQNASSLDAFKTAQSNQSASTKEIVTKIRN
ncbi:MAG: hypothetical protein ABIG61_08040 [Planctomycetota bacterium]